MAYSEQAVSAITSIPALIRAFAVARGWTSDGADGISIGSSPVWEITASIVGGNHDLLVKDKANAATRRAWTRLLKTQGTLATPVILVPTKIHLFGNDTPWTLDGQVAPFIVCVIECGYNHYRHVYIGSMVKIGSYTGGDLIAANYFSDYTTAQTTAFFSSVNHHRLFAARHNAGNGAGPVGANAGGVLVTHADNAAPWRQFDGPSGNNSRNLFLGTEVFGGHGDSINDGLVRRGVSSYAGSNILVPVNLWCSDGANGVDARFHPLGHVGGPRMIDMRGLAPGAQIEVGGALWRVFPEFSRQTYQFVTRNNPGYWWDGETSHNLAYAYPEG